MKTKKEISAGGIVFKNVLTSNQQPVTNNRIWLICQHSQHKGWTFPKGLIGDKEKNEPMEKAALREVREEGGIMARIVHPQPVQVKYIYRWAGSPHSQGSTEKFLVSKTVFYYLMEYISGDPKDHDWEMMDAKFVSSEEALKTLTFKTDKEAFERILHIATL